MKRLMALCPLLLGLAVSCTHHVKFDPVTEYVFTHEFFIGVETARSPVGDRGRACPGTPIPYASCRGPALGSEDDAEFDAYLDWRRALCESWTALLTVSPRGRFNKKAYTTYCQGNRQTWENNPRTESELNRIATNAFTESGFLHILVAQARQFAAPPAEIPLRVKNSVRYDRPALAILTRPPSGSVQIFKYCQVAGRPAVVSNLSTAEQTSCYEKHLVLLEDVAYRKDFNAWITRINNEVGKVSLKDGERFQERMYDELEGTMFYPRLRIACGAEEAQ